MCRWATASNRYPAAKAVSSSTARFASAIALRDSPRLSSSAARAYSSRPSSDGVVTSGRGELRRTLASDSPRCRRSRREMRSTASMISASDDAVSRSRAIDSRVAVSTIPALNCTTSPSWLTVPTTTAGYPSRRAISIARPCVTVVVSGKCIRLSTSPSSKSSMTFKYAD